MPKRRMLGSDDNPIGLTGAFAPVKGPQSVDYDADDDPVGLTQAFGAIRDEEDERSWNEDEKWKDFDWDAALGEPVGDYGDEDDAEEGAAQPADEAAEGEPGPEAGSASEDGAGSAPAVADEQAEPAAVSAAPAAAAASVAPSASATAAAATVRKSSGGRGRHAAPEKELSPRMKKSRRTRRVLIVLLVLLVVVVGAVGFFWYRTWTGSHQEAAQQAQEQAESPKGHEDIADAPAHDAPEATAKLADVPDLAGLLGKTQDEALAEIGRGALVTSNSEVNEDDNPIKVNLSVALTEEPADSKTGTPTVYLGLGEDGKVRQAGYSAAASALGFGSLSFADAVNTEHVVEKTLQKLGVDVAEGSAVLPENKEEYSTYASDNKTVVRERCSFEGDIDVGGAPCSWSSVLSYDYTTQVVTGNLNDTVRIIYAYITVI